MASAISNRQIRSHQDGGGIGEGRGSSGQRGVRLMRTERGSVQMTTTAIAQATPVTPATRPAKTEPRQPKALPAPNSDFYQLADVLTADEIAVVRKVRAYMDTKVQPVINKYWSDDAFPFELLPSFKELRLGGLGYEGYGCAGGSQKLFGFVAMELARVDASICTFFSVHTALSMASIS